MRRFRGWALPAALALLSGGCGEAPDAKLFERFQIDPALGLFSEVRDPAGAAFIEKNDAPGTRPQRFPLRKPPGVLRVFLVGGSVAEILNEDASVHPDLRESLESALPGRKFEVVNAGRGGSDSARDLLAAREALGYGADLLLVLSGANEGSLPPPASPGLARLYRVLRRVPLLGGRLRRALSRPGWSPGAQTPGLALDRFEENLLLLTEAAREAGVPVVLFTLPVNIRDMPPAGRLPLEDGVFFDGWLAWETGRWRDAADSFRMVVARGDASGFGRFYLARSLEKAGDLQAARRHYLVHAAVSCRQMPLRNVIVRRTAARGGAVLADLERAFAELSPLGLPGRELFEDDVHWRAVVDAWVGVSLAEALAEAGARGALRSLAPPEAWSKAGPARLRPALAERLRDRRPDPGRSLRLFRVWMWPPLLSGSAAPAFSERVLAVMESVRLASPGMLASAGEFREWFREDLQDSLWGPGAAAGLDDWWPRLLAHAAEVHRRSRQFQLAAGQFEEALSMAPGMPDARAALAVSRIALGEDERAAAAAAPLSAPERKRVARWGAALRALPRIPASVRKPAAREALAWTRLLWDQGRKDAAFRGLERVLAAHPADREALRQRKAWREELAAGERKPVPAAPVTVPAVPRPVDPAVRRLNDEGIRLFGDGKTAEAARKFEAALLLDPRSLDAVMNAAAAASRSGEPEKALGFYATALALAPGSEPPGIEADILSSRASVLASVGKSAEAARDLERALSLRGLDRGKRSLLEEELKAVNQSQAPAMRRP